MPHAFRFTPPNRVTRSIAFIAISVMVGGGIWGCKPASNKSTSNADQSWHYFDSHDDMRNKTAHYASIYSTNAAQLEFPYQGGSPVAMSVWKDDDGVLRMEPAFVLDRGQFDCHGGTEPRTCEVAVKVDASDVFEMDAKEFDCGGGHCLQLSKQMFLGSSAPSLTQKLKSARTVTVELPLFHAGSFQYSFDVSGFRW